MLVLPAPHPFAEGGWQRYCGLPATKQYSSSTMVSAVRHQKSELFSCSPSAGRPRSARAASILVFHAAIADAIFLFYFINIILKGYGVWGRLTAVEEVVAAVELARHALGDSEGLACEGGDGNEDGGGELDHFGLLGLLVLSRRRDRD